MNRDIPLARLAAPAQRVRALRLHVATTSSDALVPEAASGWEAVDAGYLIRVAALSVDATLDLKTLLGQPALLEIQSAEQGYRPYHGRIAAAERVGSNGGLARYHLTIEPGLALLRHARDLHVFRNKTCFQITEEILGWYPDLAPPVRLDVQDASTYLRYDQWTLCQESPLEALRRLWADEGVFHFFEHSGAPDTSTLGQHTLVLGDHNAAFGPSSPKTYAYHRRDATERANTLQQVRVRRQLRPTQVVRGSWDYRTLSQRPAQTGADGALPIEDHDVSGAYAYRTQAEGDRQTQRQLDALRCDASTLEGQGECVDLAAGQRMAISGHHGIAPGQAWICCAVTFQARNNLDAEVIEGAAHALGDTPLAFPVLPARLAGLGAAHLPQPSAQFADAPVQRDYQNRFQAIPVESSYRPRHPEGHGLRFQPQVQLEGLIPAIVVSDGEPIHSDRDYRVKVQLVARRGGNGSTLLAAAGGGDNAPGQAGTIAWVRVASTLVGDNFGAVWTPRAGQLVYLSPLDGQADRLVIVALAYDGAGNADAPHNQIAGGPAGAVGNAPAWFDGNRHAAVLSGIKTQALASSGDGTGGFNQLVFDATPGQGRIELSSTQADTALTLGHLKQQRDNLREADRGFGVETRTQAQAAIRAGQGLLLATEAGQQQLSANLALSQLQQSRQLLVTLGTAAKDQQAIVPDEAAPADRPAVKALQDTEQVLVATRTGTAPGNGIDGGDGTAPAWSSPVQVVSSPAAIVAVTPADQIVSSGTQVVQSAGDAINWAVQDTMSMAVAGAVQLFTHGQASGGSQNPETGIAAHAATGPVQVRALNNTATLAAQKSVQIASTSADVTVMSPASHVLATAAGAYLKIEGGNIELGAPGTIEFKASIRDFTGPASASGDLPELPKTQGLFTRAFALYSLEGTALEGAKIALYDPDKRTLLWQGAVDASGAAATDVKPENQAYMALAGFDDWSDVFENTDGTAGEEEGSAEASEEDGREEESEVSRKGHV